MALISVPEIEAALDRAYGARLLTKTAAAVLEEDRGKAPYDFPFDVFLSHSYADAELNRERILGLKALLEDLNYTVYVDWIVDASLSREYVSKETAAVLRSRMMYSRSLLFATSETSQNSKWMPWELGFKDGQSSVNGKLGTVAILPIARQSGTYAFNGQEYLGMYPYIDKTAGTQLLWVHEDAKTYVKFSDWLNGKKPTKR